MGGNCNTIDAAKLLNGVLLDMLKNSLSKESSSVEKKAENDEKPLDKSEKCDTL
jgi:hypothetical protein